MYRIYPNIYLYFTTFTFIRTSICVYEKTIKEIFGKSQSHSRDMKNFEKVYILVNDMNQDMNIKYNYKYEHVGKYD